MRVASQAPNHPLLPLPSQRMHPLQDDRDIILLERTELSIPPELIPALTHNALTNIGTSSSSFTTSPYSPNLRIYQSISMCFSVVLYILEGAMPYRQGCDPDGR